MEKRCVFLVVIGFVLLCFSRGVSYESFFFLWVVLGCLELLGVEDS